MRSIFHVYADEGHSWMKVSLKDIKMLNMTPKDFSQYSYRYADNLYLEEDCDAALFIKSWRKANPEKEITFREHYTSYQSRIRSYYHNA